MQGKAPAAGVLRHIAEVKAWFPRLSSLGRAEVGLVFGLPGRACGGVLWCFGALSAGCDGLPAMVQLPKPPYRWLDSGCCATIITTAFSNASAGPAAERSMME